jgi:hypothetical protein
MKALSSHERMRFSPRGPRGKGRWRPWQRAMDRSKGSFLGPDAPDRGVLRKGEAMANVSRTMKAGKDGKIVTALRNKVIGLDQLPLGGSIYTQDEAADLIEKRIVANNAVEQAKAAWLHAIKVYEELSAQVDVVERDLRHVVMGACGEQSPKMAEFDFQPPKHAVLTLEQKAEAARKRMETRKARKTMGRRQKKAIKGVMPAVVIAVAGTNASVAPAAATEVNVPHVVASTPPIVGPEGGGAGGASG